MRGIFNRFSACRWLFVFIWLGWNIFSAAAQEPAPLRTAEFVSATMPAVVVTGQVFTVFMTVSNAGPMAWQSARPYLMAAWELCFLFDQANQGWVASHGLDPVQWTSDWGGVIFADQNADDAFLTKDISNCGFLGGPDDRVYVRVFAQSNHTEKHDPLKLYWTTTKQGFYSETRSVLAQQSGDDSRMELRFDVGTHPDWQNSILTSLRLDFDETNRVHTRWILDQFLVLRDGGTKTAPMLKDAFELSVPAGETATFNVSCQAPAQPGIRRYDWCMGEKNAGWFGASCGKAIQIVDSSNSLAAAQNVVSYGASSWHTDNGLPHNVVQALAQTADGYLWIGTQKGLARFDGARFTVFNPENSPGLKSANVTALCAASDGTLWIGTESGGVTRRQQDNFTFLGDLAAKTIRCIYETSDGGIWFGTTIGLFRWQQNKWTIWTTADGLSDNVIRSLCEATNGDLWIGTGKRLSRMVGGKIVGSYDASNGLDTVSIRGLCRDRYGEIWIASNTGLFCKTGDEFISFSKADGLEDRTCITVQRDRRGTLWVGSAGGLNRMAEGRFITELTASGEGFDAVNAMLEDFEGNVWIGGKDGLHRLRPTPFTTYTRRTGLSHNNVMSVCEDATGTIWAGTWGGGANRFKNGRFSTLNLNKGLVGIQDQAIDQIMGLCPLRDGSVWIGYDYERGLARWDPEQGFVESYGKAGERFFGTMRIIFLDRSGVLWLGTRDGLYRVQDGQFQRFGTAEGLPHDSIRSIFEDHEGTLWIGTQKGVVRRKADRFEKVGEGSTLAQFPVVSFFQEEEHGLWMGTTGAGLHLLKNEKLTSFTSKQGLFSDDVHGILSDDFGNFWMGCRQGVFRVSRKNLSDVAEGKAASITNVSYGLQEGLVSTECNIIAQPNAWKSRDGRIWFATAKGLSVIDPKLNLRINEKAPPVIIEEVLADKKRIQEKTGNGAAALLIPPGRGELEIHYAALSYTAPEMNRFKYKLEGLDSDWVDAATRRDAFYNNVPPGDYTFRVIGCNNDGVWNALGANVKLSLQPHYWQTWWCKLSLLLASLSLAAAGARFLTRRRMQLKLERLEQQHAVEKERTRIAQDMHDDLGIRLTEILLLGNLASASNVDGVKEHVSKMTNVARDVVRGLDAIVWAVNPKNDSLDQLALYTCEYLEKLLGMTSIRCRLNVPDELPDQSLSADIRHNLFLVIKEAVNNMVKHAQATELRFSLQVTGSILSIAIEDDGRGFPIAENSSRGNGLQNMEKRMKNVGGKFELRSEPGKGTRIRLEIPIHR
jgi:ligand-binding sensor domain-containing protein/signal transduction histidine kinase